MICRVLKGGCRVVKGISVTLYQATSPAPTTKVCLRALMEGIILRKGRVRAKQGGGFHVSPWDFLGCVTRPDLRLLVQRVNVEEASCLRFPRFQAKRRPFPLSASRYRFGRLHVGTMVRVGRLSSLLLCNDLRAQAGLLSNVLCLNGKDPKERDRMGSILLYARDRTPYPNVSPSGREAGLFVFCGTICYRGSGPLP